jgi:hypothetical protein
MNLNKEVLEKQIKTMEKLVSHLHTIAIKKGISLSSKILHNPSVSKAIRNYTKSHKFDLIVIGSSW